MNKPPYEGSFNSDTAVGQLKRLLTDISPFIEQYTQDICPQCREVCCKQRHAFPEEKDLLFLDALGVDALSGDPQRPPDGPCQFLGDRGCIKPRWMRPLRCTWFFCEPLLRAMNEGSQRMSRRLTGMLGEIVRLRNELSVKVSTGSFQRNDKP